MKLGAQLFTVREFCKDLDGFADSLKRLADIGYSTVQINGSCVFEAEWLKEQFDNIGIECIMPTVPGLNVAVDTEKVIENHKIIGSKYVSAGHVNTRKVGAQGFVDQYRETIKKVREAGLMLLRHNHDHEFLREANGKISQQNLADLIAPEDMGFVLDLYWVQAGGGDPIWWLNNLKGRTPVVHFKDMTYGLVNDEYGRKIAAIGEGNMNYEGIIEACYNNGVEYTVVELDHCYGEDPFECLKRSYNYLKDKIK